ncbi:MAG TPA: AraC family transcriptional regulator, partial [Bacillota bacterium]|nr:AraC family transcriptional regulator [Bacillota bacterium]
SNNWVAEFGLKTESRLGHRVVLYLTNHYSRKITIAELTKEFNLNRNSLYQEFQETTGLSLIAYLIRLRIKMASVLLAETSMPVAEIMERVGYTDLTHFGRAFKKITGFTPIDYRKQNRLKTTSSGENRS